MIPFTLFFNLVIWLHAPRQKYEERPRASQQGKGGGEFRHFHFTNELA